MQSVINQIRYLLATPIHFNNWLSSLDPQTVVGESLDCSRCPIHTFLAENVEGINPAALDVYCTHVSYGVSPNHQVVEADRTHWWCKFIYTLDMDSDVQVRNSPVSALLCSAVMEAIGYG